MLFRSSFPFGVCYRGLDSLGPVPKTMKKNLFLIFAAFHFAAWAQELSENPYGVESTANPYGQYGSPFGIESVNNPFGRGIPLETRQKDSGLGIEDWGDQKSSKLEGRTEVLDQALARQRQELEAERIELTAEAERLAKEFEAKIQAEMVK